MSNRSEKREIELINKEVWRERKQKVLNRINWFTHNVQVAEELVSSESQDIISYNTI